MNLPRTLRTVTHLRPGQLGWRLYRRAARLRGARAVAAPERIALRDELPTLPWDCFGGGGDVEAGRDGEDAHAWLDELEQGRFTHLNRSMDLGAQRPDWRLGLVRSDRLWTVTLHYHEWAERLAHLVAAGDDEAARADRLLRHYLADWIARCDLDAAGARDLAWNPYAVATRIGHWVRLFHALGRAGRAEWGELEPRFLRSLWKQAAYLERNVEWDLRANHLLRDAVGLAWAGRFFEGERPRKWLDTATRLAAEQAIEQVLPDGGHFERSPMYHLHVMADLATAASLVEDETVRDELRQTWARMAEFAAWVRHPDGQIPLLNDAALNGAPRPADLLRQGSDGLGVALDLAACRGRRHFADFGLVAWHDPAWSVFFDIGPVGVDYQPGHAHADTLTFEASHRGHRLIVDPGTFAYDLDDRRAYDRSTAAHNTVTIDDVDSSEVWHIFRVGRRARPMEVSIDPAVPFRVSAAHDGYRFLPGRPIHRRTVEIADGELHVTDDVEGGGEHEARGGLLIHPDWRVERIGQGGWRLRCGELAVTIRIHGPPSLACSEEAAACHPQFGVERMTQRLTWRCGGELPIRVQAVIAAADGDVTDGAAEAGDEQPRAAENSR